MNKSILQTAALAAVALIVAQFISTGPAEAGSWRRVGPNGTVGGFARAGQYGHSAGAGAWRPGVGGFGGGAYRYSGPNGGTSQGAGAGAWKRGVGGWESSSRQYSNPNGNSMSAYSNGKYNAQTGQGQFNSGKSGTYDGQNYGYTENTAYTKGKGGATNLDTTNHGDYTVNYAPGQKPVVTQTP